MKILSRLLHLERIEVIHAVRHGIKDTGQGQVPGHAGQVKDPGQGRIPGLDGDATDIPLGGGGAAAAVAAAARTKVLFSSEER